MLEKRALEKVWLQVTNAPEGWKRSRDFDYMFANSILMAFDGTPEEACGFDPTALAVRAGEQTVAAQLAAERAGIKEEE